MIPYLTQWFHAYVTHFGFWMTFIFACAIYQGIPELNELPGKLKTAVVLSTVLAIFSSHSHIHYLTNFVK